MKPEVQVVKMQQQHMICTSPNGYDNNQNIPMNDDPGEEISHEEDIFWGCFYTLYGIILIKNIKFIPEVVYYNDFMSIFAPDKV